MKNKLTKSNGIKVPTPADCLSREELQQVEQWFLSQDFSKINNLRNYTLFSVNNNIGLRAKDLLSLPKDTVIDSHDQVKDVIQLYESKTHKSRIIELNNRAKTLLQAYYNTFKNKLKDSFYLFPSNKVGQGEGHLTISSYDRILRQAHAGSGLSDYVTLSSHTSRKTLGTALFEAGIDIQTIQAMFGHSKAETTLVYIGTFKRKAQSVYSNVSL